MRGLFSLMLSLLCLILSLAGGFFFTYFCEPCARSPARRALTPCERLCGGATLGWAVWGSIGLALAFVFGLTAPVAFVVALLTAVLPLTFLGEARVRLVQRDAQVAACNLKRRMRRRRLITRGEWGGAAYTLLWGVSLFAFFSRVMIVRPDGSIATGVLDCYADLTYHLGIIHSFVSAGPIPPEQPGFSGARLTYPFLSDFGAALLVKTGSRTDSAILAQNLTLGAALVGLIYSWTLRFTGNRTAAHLAPVVALFGGGLGAFLLAPGDLHAAGSAGGFLSHLPRNYTNDDAAQIHWGNALTYWFAPMRSMILGAPLALFLWTLWRNALDPTVEGQAKRRFLVVAGVLTGLAPLAHAHTYAVTLVLGPLVALAHGELRNRDARRSWAIYTLIAVMVALPQGLLLASDTAMRPGAFIGWHWGWMTPPGASVSAYWLRNTGAFIPILAAVLLWGKLGRSRLRFYAPFLLCFALPNVAKFAPWEWDNIKIFYVWWLASAPLVALGVARLWNARPTRLPRCAAPVCAAVLVLVLTLSGALDVWRVVSRSTEWEIYDAGQVAFARYLDQATPPRSLLLSAPRHNTPALLSGRRSVLGYEGLLWTHGIEAGPRASDVRRIYAGEGDAPALLARYGVSFVIIGPQERDWAREANTPLNEPFFAARYERLPAPPPYAVYVVH